MRRVSAIVLLMALGAQGFGTNHQGSALGRDKQNLLENTSLQLSRWEQDGYRNQRYDDRRQYGNQNDYTGPPTIYNEAPKSTEQGWWNEEKRNVGNRRDTRKYSNSKYGSSIVPVSSDKYDVTPDEWRSGNAYDNSGNYQRERTYRSNGSYQGGQGTGYFDGRQRQTLRANDQDRRAQPYRGYQQYGGNDYRYEGNANSYNNYDPNDVTPSEWRDQQRQQGSNSGYNYGFGNGSQGEVVGTYDSSYDNSYYQDNNYRYSNQDRNDVTPQEWKGQNQRRNDNMYYDNQQYNSYNGNQQGYYDQGYDQGYYNNDGLYDTTSQQGDWWNEEKRDFSTNLGRQETRSYSGSRSMSNSRGGVTPDEWNGDRQYDYSYDMRQQQPINYYQDNRQGPNRPNDSWWGKVKRGFKNVGYNRNGGRRYDDRRGNGRYDDRREYVTRRDPQENDDWWKTEKVDYTTW